MGRPQGVAQRGGVIVRPFDAEDDPHRADKDFAGGERGDEPDADAPVETERLDDGLDDVAGAPGETLGDLRGGRGVGIRVLGVGGEEPEHD